MSIQERERLIAKHDALCEEFNETEDEALLEQIGLIEYVLFWSE